MVVNDLKTCCVFTAMLAFSKFGIHSVTLPEAIMICRRLKTDKDVQEKISKYFGVSTPKTDIKVKDSTNNSLVKYCDIFAQKQKGSIDQVIVPREVKPGGLKYTLHEKLNAILFNEEVIMNHLKDKDGKTKVIEAINKIYARQD